MRWLKQLFGRTDAVELHVPADLQFLGEQDGESERLVKSRWKKVLAVYPAVLRAYLVLATPDGGQTISVVLGIRQSHDKADVALVHALGDCFRSIFNNQTFVDILFLSEEREAAVRAVCPPFYSVGNSLQP